MSLLDFKFNESDFIGKKIGDLSDTPSSDGMTAEALKAYFDYIPKTMIALGAVNNIIDLLVSSAGAESIGANVSGVTGTQVQSILESVKTMLDDRYTKSAADGLLDTKADTTTVNAMVKSISYDKDTGTLTITEQGGSTYTIDTLLEKLAVNFAYDRQLQSLIITLSDGTVQTVPLSDFITETEILPTDTIAVTERDGKITLDIKSGSITDEMLSSAILAAIDGYVQSCASSAASAEASAKNAKEYSDSAAGSASSALASKNAASASEQASAQSKTDATSEKLKAEGWARGTKNNVNVPSTDETYHNNSKWYSEQSALSAVAALSAQNAAEDARDRAQQIVGGNFANHTFITIPAGRMRGDIDGDGNINANDIKRYSNGPTSVETISAYSNQTLSDLFPDGNIPLDFLAADVLNDGVINTKDLTRIKQLNVGNYSAGQASSDILGNWTNNPNYATEEGQFYTDIPITGMTTNHSASVIVKGTYESGFFTKAECVDGAIRIYAKLCPIEALTAVVSWGTGDGTAVITTESEDLTVYDAHIADADIHVTAEEKAVWNEKEVFIAIYETTTFAEILEAYQAGKTVLLQTNSLDSTANNIYTLSAYLGSMFYFGRVTNTEQNIKIETIYISQLGNRSTSVILSFYDDEEMYYFRSLKPSYNEDGTFKSFGFKFKCIDDSITALKTINVPVLPSVTADDNGKILKVVDGVWTAVTPS